jgi:hypothetical protein
MYMPMYMCVCSHTLTIKKKISKVKKPPKLQGKLDFRLGLWYNDCCPRHHFNNISGFESLRLCDCACISVLACCVSRVVWGSWAHTACSGSLGSWALSPSSFFWAVPVGTKLLKRSHEWTQGLYQTTRSWQADDGLEPGSGNEMQPAAPGLGKDLVWIFRRFFGNFLFLMWWMMLGWRAEILWPQIKYIFSSDKLDHLLISLAVPCPNLCSGSTQLRKEATEQKGPHSPSLSSPAPWPWVWLLNLLGSVPSYVHSISDL